MHLCTLQTLHYDGKVPNDEISLVPDSLPLSLSQEKRDRGTKSKTREGKREGGRERERQGEGARVSAGGPLLRLLYSASSLTLHG